MAAVIACCSQVGSPPRVRERLNGMIILIREFGITPACAGKTNSDGNALRSYEDHPRVCGKDALRASTITSLGGSPPRVRERHLIDLLFIEVCG